MKRCACMFAALVSFSAVTTPAAAQTNLIANGSFEANGGAGTSIFTNWSVSNIAGGSGSWYVQTGTGSPLNNFIVPVPTNGVFAAMTDQTGPGTHVIIQSFVAPAGGLAS